MIHATDLFYARRSVRSYRKDPIPGDDMHAILSAGLSAPSGEGIHPLELVVIKSDAAKAKIKEFNEWAGFCEESPVSILICYDRNKLPEEYVDNEALGKLDAAACAENMLLCATALGISSCWTHALENQQDYRALCSLPENIVPTALVVLGYSDDQCAPRDGFDQAKIHDEQWREE
jgi:nitroreductase